MPKLSLLEINHRFDTAIETLIQGRKQLKALKKYLARLDYDEREEILDIIAEQDERINDLRDEYEGKHEALTAREACEARAETEEETDRPSRLDDIQFPNWAMGGLAALALGVLGIPVIVEAQPDEPQPVRFDYPDAIDIQKE